MLDEEVRARLLSISPATVDRLLSEVRLAAAGGRRRRAGLGSAIRRAVPVRTFNDWGDPSSGFVEVDLVAHGGTSVSGSSVQTLVLTDIATGWTECVPILLRQGGLVIEAITKAITLFPFPLGGVDLDNDSVFMNEVVVGWCREAGLEVTRARLTGGSQKWRAPDDWPHYRVAPGRRDSRTEGRLRLYGHGTVALNDGGWRRFRFALLLRLG